MKVLTIANRKGGAGKSTCAAHLAVEAVKLGIKTILIDMDPQKTLEGWWQKRSEENPYLIEASAPDLENVIEKLRNNNFDLCIIDTPGDASINALSGMKVADLIVIPSKPTAPDLTAIGRTISMVEESKISYVFVITQGIIRAKATLQAASVLSQFGAVAPAVISNRTSYATAMGIGSSAVETDKQAAEEISQVWEFIKSRLFESPKSSKKKLTA
ncbi:ParA family protein [Candidatus Odyssella thessalonicensis]|uniref:ParA family protein n=1 Tax=Candidatus Odyssella thessalonicensis TaxID=84647 RepID=UPI000225B236|nr:ParA family protein [Candidatus Odyssella thessalonicensis]